MTNNAIALCCLGVSISMLGACDSISDDRARIEDARLLAVRASPPVLAGIEGRVELDSLFVDGDGFRRASQPVTYRACSPWVFVSDPERDCPATSAMPLPRAELSVAALFDFYPPPVGPQPGASESSEGETPCQSTPALEVPIVASTFAEGFDLVTIKRVPIYLDEIERRNPRIATIELVEDLSDGGTKGDERIAFSLDPDSLDPRCGDDGQEGQGLEAIRVHFYASSGELEPKTVDIVPSGEGEVEPGELRWMDAEPGAMLWLVAIDGDGGVGWRNKDDI